MLGAVFTPTTATFYLNDTTPWFEFEFEGTLVNTGSNDVLYVSEPAGSLPLVGALRLLRLYQQQLTATQFGEKYDAESAALASGSPGAVPKAPTLKP